MILFFIIIIILIFYTSYRKVKRLSQYIVFLEDEYYNLITILKNSTQDKRNFILEKATQTTLFKKIRCSKADNIERFKMMYEDNNLKNNRNNDNIH